MFGRRRPGRGSGSVVSASGFWCEDAGVRVNISKTKMREFRQASRLEKRAIIYQQRPIGIVSEFKYSGVTMQPGIGFSLHVERLKHRALVATASRKDLQEIHMEGAMAVFRLITYCLRQIAPELTSTALKQLDAVKPSPMKMVMGIPYNASNTLALETLESRGAQFRSDP